MPINNEKELEQAVAEYQRLAEAPAGSPEEMRRRDLDADIKAFYARCSDEMRVAKPPHD
jgi:hypothetical protein